ncbi:hypothetical protein FOPG_08600 [Fusarium oxysporum f. sp. conglutinans race 2 54008]|uniref:Fascin-like domain-containing protein n=1 Tax=Fusarium oxysporum f. sp. conglutinans race 2 54008 TaxID=1089457 RepID=X0HJW4_FUSOX|nr:hypothetical protein FOPG_08600 [Fusarium oxysporum f. sp. conglutinans race 2 54008]
MFSGLTCHLLFGSYNKVVYPRAIRSDPHGWLELLSAKAVFLPSKRSEDASIGSGNTYTNELYFISTRPNQNGQPTCGSLPENPYGDYKIQATLGKYVASAANGGHLSASGTSANDSGAFSSAYLPNAGTLQLARSNQYVTADQSGASALSASRATASTWERFIIRQKVGESQGIYSIKAASNGKYLRVGDDGAIENDATGFRFVKA